MQQYSSIKSALSDIAGNSIRIGIYTGKIKKEDPLEIEVFEESMPLYHTDIIVPEHKVKINGSKSKIEYDLEKDDIVYLLNYGKRYMIIGNKKEDEEDGGD